MRNGQWTPLMGSLLATKTIGLIGLGRIGNAVAKLAQAYNGAADAGADHRRRGGAGRACRSR